MPKSDVFNRARRVSALPIVQVLLLSTSNLVARGRAKVIRGSTDEPHAGCTRAFTSCELVTALNPFTDTALQDGDDLTVVGHYVLRGDSPPPSGCSWPGPAAVAVLQEDARRAARLLGGASCFHPRRSDALSDMAALTGVFFLSGAGDPAATESTERAAIDEIGLTAFAEGFAAGNPTTLRVSTNWASLWSRLNSAGTARAHTPGFGAGRDETDCAVC